MFWVVGALLAAVLTGFGSRGVPAPDEKPTLIVDRPSPSAADSGAADETSESQQLTSDALVLERSRDGHFYAEAEINGEQIRMLVDTGASSIALSREDARRAGIGTSIGMPEVIGHGASGEVRGEVVMIDKIALGNIEAEEFEAVVLDQGQMSLLGQSFLANFDSVEIRGNQMVLR